MIKIKESQPVRVYQVVVEKHKKKILNWAGFRFSKSGNSPYRYDVFVHVIERR